jgi:hypothetical protein
MDNGFICTCGNDLFWFFIDHVRCSHCFKEYKESSKIKSENLKESYKELWVRSFNINEHKYDIWEKLKK